MEDMYDEWQTYMADRELVVVSCRGFQAVYFTEMFERFVCLFIIRGR